MCRVTWRRIGYRTAMSVQMNVPTWVWHLAGGVLSPLTRHHAIRHRGTHLRRATALMSSMRVGGAIFQGLTKMHTQKHLCNVL